MSRRWSMGERLARRFDRACRCVCETLTGQRETPTVSDPGGALPEDPPRRRWALSIPPVPTAYDVQQGRQIGGRLPPPTPPRPVLDGLAGIIRVQRWRKEY